MTTAATTIPAADRIQQAASSKPQPRPRQWPKPIWSAIVFTRFWRSYIRHKRTGANTPANQADMRRLFRMTNGRFNDAVARLESVLHPARPLPAGDGVLGDLSTGSLTSIAGDLRRDGFHWFDAALPGPACQRLIDFAHKAPCRVSPLPASGPIHVFDPRRILGTQYQLDPQSVHENPDVQRLVMDMSLISVAQAYLGCAPVCLGCDMWWSTAFSKEASSESAQLFHFDMSQIKFLKIFMYLTDVDEANGPHAYVLGSHRRAPETLLADRRYGDDEIRAHYPDDRIINVAGRAGSMFAEDTRGFHKGTPLKHGHRLLLQILYAVSGFGEQLPAIDVNDRFLPEFVEATRRFHRIFGHRFKRRNDL